MSKPTPRCVVCNKKSILNLTCKCGVFVCMKHRMPEAHPCTYDVKAEKKKELEKMLVKVTAKKIDTI